MSPGATVSDPVIAAGSVQPLHLTTAAPGALPSLLNANQRDGTSALAHGTVPTNTATVPTGFPSVVVPQHQGHSLLSMTALASNTNGCLPLEVSGVRGTTAPPHLGLSVVAPAMPNVGGTSDGPSASQGAVLASGLTLPTIPPVGIATTAMPMPEATVNTDTADVLTTAPNANQNNAPLLPSSSMHGTDSHTAIEPSNESVGIEAAKASNEQNANTLPSSVPRATVTVGSLEPDVRCVTSDPAAVNITINSADTNNAPPTTGSPMSPPIRTHLPELPLK